MDPDDPTLYFLWARGAYDQVHEKLLEWLIPVAYDDHQAEFAKRRHPGTLQWFLDSDTYQEWIHATPDLDLEEQTQELRTLFCPGPAGAGKTILTSAVIQDLGRRFPHGSDSNVGIAYLYCFYNCDCPGQQSTTNLLLVLLEQLLPSRPRRQFPTRISHGKGRMSKESPSSTHQYYIRESLEEVIPKYDRVFFVIDGLDECAAEERTGLLKEIFTLQAHNKVHLFVTSDSDSNVQHRFANAPSLEIRADHEDVRSYLEHSLDELPAFVREDPVLKKKIKDAIIKAAPGSFLAAVLQLKSLAAMSSVEDVRTALAEAERDSALTHYDAPYEAAMRRIESQDLGQTCLAQRALYYVLHARCSWSAAELCHAFAVKVGETELDWDSMPSLQVIVAACSGMLVTVGSEERDEPGEIDNLDEAFDSNEVATMRQIWHTTVRLDRIAVRLVHRTAHEYLQRTCERWFPEGEKQVAATCMTYLSLPYFRDSSYFHKSGGLQMRLRTFPLFDYAALYWGFHARTAFDKLPDISSLEFQFLSCSELIEACRDVSCRIDQWPLGHYVDGMNGLQIAAHFRVANLVRALARKPGAMVNALNRSGHTALTTAAEQGHEEIVEAILEVTGIDVDIRSERGETPMILAADGNHTTIVKMLLDHGANPNLKDFRQATPLWRAAHRGHTATAALLTRYGVDVNVASDANATPGLQNLQTPLSLAVGNGQDEMVSLLLDQPNIQPRATIGFSLGGYSLPGWYSSRTPLGLAAKRGDSKIVKLLLSNPDIALAARTGEDGEMLLHLAISSGHKETARVLLNHNIDVNAQNEVGSTPLHVAIDGFSEARHDIVRLLLDQASVVPDLADKNGYTPALLAVRHDQIEILRLLLAKGVDTKARTNDGLTLLGLAAERGYLSIVELLLATDGVDADPRDSEGRTPLTLAAIRRWYDESFSEDEFFLPDHCGVIQCLLNSGRVDINSHDDSGQTPLMYATRSGEDEYGYDNEDDFSCLRILLDHEEVEINAMDEKGLTALSWAVVQGEQDSAILLLEKGADPNLGRFYEGDTLLSLAAGRGMAELVRVLISYDGVDAQERNADGHTALCKAAVGKSGQVFEVLVHVGGIDLDARCSHGQTPLHHAITTSLEEEFAPLPSDKGIWSVDAQEMKGETPLRCASVLLYAGVNFNCENLKGRTPLSLAAQRGQRYIVKELLSIKGVIVDARDKTGRTPLSWAVQPKSTNASDIMKRLLGAEGVDPNAEDEKGWTPLFWAVQGDEASDLVEVLLTEGAGRVNVDHEDREGRTVLELAQKRGHEVVVGQLLSVGAREKGMIEHPVSLDKHEDGKQHGKGILTVKVDEPACEWKAEAQRDSDRDSQTGDEVVSGDEGKDEEGLCPQCKDLYLGDLFSRVPVGESGYNSVLEDPVTVDKSWESRPCAMCKLLAAVRPPGESNTCQPRTYSSTTTWLSADKKTLEHYFSSNWVDTMLLGLDSSPDWSDSAETMRKQGHPHFLPHRFVSRIGSNDRRRLRSLAIHRPNLDQADFGRARDWIACCAAHHGERCNPSNRRRITSFRLIDCTSREIVDSQSAMDQFVALSYVWGSSAREPTAVDHVYVENAERVVEDAIQATRALGYRYLWVDRHCITNENKEIRRKQLLEMDAVYANAEVTIVAAAGEDSTFGLPGVSRARQRQPCVEIQGHTLVAMPCEPAKGIQSSVWWTRGWTFQEGVLSRRRLVFTEQEIWYECEDMLARESVEVPERIQRIDTTRYPIQEGTRAFSSQGYYGTHDDSFSIWLRISEYTERHLTHEYDILNAMLGIMEAAAQGKSPVYHLCGVPIALGSSDEPGNSTLLEAFAAGLCWDVQRGTRREGFPSWSWTGWKGKAYPPYKYSVSFKFGCAIKVSMVPQDDPSGTLSWAEFEAMAPKEKAALPQDYILEITGIAVDVEIRYTAGDTPYVILYNDHDALEGSTVLCRDPEQDAGFQRRLTEERLTAIVVGNEVDNDERLILLAVIEVGDYWERIGVIKVKSEHELDVHGSGCRTQTFLIR